MTGTEREAILAGMAELPDDNDPDGNIWEDTTGDADETS